MQRTNKHGAWLVILPGNVRRAPYIHENYQDPSVRVPAGLPWTDPLGHTDRFDDARRYLRDFYSFGGMQTTIKPLSIRHPVLYYALAWIAQCQLDVVRPTPDSLTSLSIKGILLKYLAQQLPQVKASTSHVFILASLLFTFGLGMTSRSKHQDYQGHFWGIDHIMAKCGGVKGLINEEVGPFIARQIYTTCAAARVTTGVELPFYNQLSTVSEYTFERLFNSNVACNNPFTTDVANFKKTKHVRCTRQTARILCDAKELCEIVVSSTPDISLIAAAHGKLTMLKRRFKGYHFAPSGTDHIYEACRLVTLILFQMAAQGISTRFEPPAGTSDQVDEMLERLSLTLQKTDIVGLWGDFKGVLYWITTIGMCMSMHTPQEYHFKAIAARLMMFYAYCDRCTFDVVKTLREFIKYQDACKGGRWMETLKQEESSVEVLDFALP